VSRLKDVKIQAPAKNRPTKVLTIDAQTAELLRRVARVDGLGMSAFLDRCLRAYVEKWHPDWEMVEEDEDVLAEDLRAGTKGQKSVFGRSVAAKGSARRQRKPRST
jgi:hypothetical protein